MKVCYSSIQLCETVFHSIVNCTIGNGTDAMAHTMHKFEAVEQKRRVIDRNRSRNIGGTSHKK